MIRSYIKSAWRNLLKHKSFSLINIVGLSIGIAACLIIFIYVRNELTFDQYNLEKDRIARITSFVHTPESDLRFGTSPTPLADALMRDFPEVELAVRLEPTAKLMKLNNEIIREGNFFTADQGVFSVFTFNFLEGNANEALTKPKSVVITKRIARKYFGNKPALGKTLVADGDELRVTAVIKDRPPNSDIKIDALMSHDFSTVTSWMVDLPVYTFVLLRDKNDLTRFERKLVKPRSDYGQAELDAQGATNYAIKYEVEPLSEVHFSQGKLNDTAKGNKQFNYIFSLLAVFILLIAILNYINLSTARATERAREVGVRKATGAQRAQLVYQFLFESMLLMAIAWVVAFGILQGALPFFNHLLGTEIAANWGEEALTMIVLSLVVLLLAGLYPALALSRFEPAKVLKGVWRNTSKGIFLRKAITFVQFGVAGALIMGTVVIYRQMNFIQQQDIGFNKNQLVNIDLPRDSVYRGEVRAFQQALRQRPEVHGITIGNGMKPDDYSIATTFAEKGGGKREFMCNYYAIDPQFLEVFGIPLVAGRNLSADMPTDKQEAFLVNETFVKNMGWKSGLGKSIEGWDHKGKVVGVVNDFYYKSMHNVIEPLALVYNTFPANTTTIRIKPSALPEIKTLYKKYLPSSPFDYSFVDEMIEKQYQKDHITMSLFTDFTVLAIFVSCLGLYGLVALLSAQRIREIGIRKVLGASLRQLFSIQATELMKLVSWSLIASLPLAAMIMHKWLSNYAYHITLSWWMFLIPALLIPAIALAVISREVIRSALANPVKSLKTE